MTTQSVWKSLSLLTLLAGLLALSGTSETWAESDSSNARVRTREAPKPAAVVAAPHPSPPQPGAVPPPPPPAPSSRARRAGAPSSAPTPASQPADGPGYDFSLAGYGGIAVPTRTDLGFVDSDPSIGDNFTAKDASLKNSPVFGVKATAWAPWARRAVGVDFGAELDYSYFRPTLKENQELVATGNDALGPVTGIQTTERQLTAQIMAINILVRLPMGVTPEFPHGRWYPYAGIGGGVQVARAKVTGTQFSDTDISPVRQILAGAKVFLTRRIALFGEYKNTHASHTFQFGTSTQELSITANHFVGGVAFHF